MFIFLISKFMENHLYEYKNSLIFNVKPIIRLFKIDLPKIKKELYLISATVFVLTLGDLTSVTIFNDSSFNTIPLYISQLYSNYRYDDAFFVLSLFIIIILLIISIPFRLSSKMITNNLKYIYPKFVVDFNFEITSPEIVGVIGKIGSGKSTLFNLILVLKPIQNIFR